MRLTKETKERICLLGESGMAITKIAIETKVSYGSAYNILDKKGLLKRHNVYNNELAKFNYREYVETIIKRCQKLLQMDDNQIKEFLKTKKGELAFLRETEFYTPQIHMFLLKNNTKIDRKV